MKLQDYFAKVQSYKLSEKEKNALYERILRQTQYIPYQTPLFSRARFYMKVVWYMVFLVVVWLSVYLPFLSQRNEKPSEIAGIVSASYIAKVVNVQWEYHIESDGKRIEWANISDGNTVILSKDSSLVVQVGDRVEGKITGPATFSVAHNDKWYSIILKQGDYIEVAALWDQTNAPEVSLISETHKFTARTQAGKNFHFILTEKNAKPLLVNQSNDDIQITNEKEPNKILALAENKSMWVESTYIFATTVSPREVAEVVAEKTAPEWSAPRDDFNNSFFRWMLLASAEPQNSDTTSTSLTTTASTEETNSIKEAKVTINKQVVRSNLLPQFVWVDIKYITYYYLNGQENEYHIAYENFLKRMYNLYDALYISIPSEWVLSSQKDWYSIDKLTILASYLQQHIPTKEVPEHQEKTLYTIVTFLQKLSQQSFWTYKWQNLNLEQMFEKIQ